MSRSITHRHIQRSTGLETGRRGRLINGYALGALAADIALWGGVVMAARVAAKLMGVVS